MDTAATVTVRIVEPHGAYAQYETDGGTVRLSAIGYPHEDSPADLAIIPGTGRFEGDALEVLLLGDVAHPPDCLVDVVPLGLLSYRRDSHSASYILAVASVDPRHGAADELDALPAGWRACLERSFRAEEVCWGSRAEAWATIRQAHQAARLARVGGSHGPSRPAWLPDRADLPMDQRDAAAETARHSHAEYSFYTLPLRFQKYVADYLTPEERVRFFVPRPRMASALQRGWLRRAQLAEGIVLLTTEQLLFLEEVLPPDVTEMPYGYLVTGIPVERLTDVTLDEQGASLRLGWATATAGEAWTHVEFPAACHAALRALREQLAAYLPRVDDRRLQRIYRPEVAAPDLRDPAANAPEEAAPAIARLTARLEQALLPGEDALAQAFIPAWFEHSGGQARLLVITGERVLVLAEGDPEADQRYSIGQIASLELRASILGSWLVLAMPEHGRITRAELHFPSTGFGFQTCYRTLRQVLANPHTLAEEAALCASPS